ncbi:hypothetical protein JF66_21835, partial [Cryobacterium sp. MLB-32]
MKKLLSIASTTIILLAGIAFASPASAETMTATTPDTVAAATTHTASQPSPNNSAEMFSTQTGNYEYNCVLTSGYSYFMSSGEPLTNCKGSYLQKYLDGRQLDSVALAYGGGAASTFNWSVGCILSVGSGVLLVVYPPTG